MTPALLMSRSSAGNRVRSSSAAAAHRGLRSQVQADDPRGGPRGRGARSGRPPARPCRVAAGQDDLGATCRGQHRRSRSRCPAFAPVTRPCGRSGPGDWTKRSRELEVDARPGVLTRVRHRRGEKRAMDSCDRRPQQHGVRQPRTRCSGDRDGGDDRVRAAGQPDGHQAQPWSTRSSAGRASPRRSRETALGDLVRAGGADADQLRRLHRGLHRAESRGTPALVDAEQARPGAPAGRGPAARPGRIPDVMHPAACCRRAAAAGRRGRRQAGLDHPAHHRALQPARCSGWPRSARSNGGRASVFLGAVSAGLGRPRLREHRPACPRWAHGVPGCSCSARWSSWAWSRSSAAWRSPSDRPVRRRDPVPASRDQVIVSGTPGLDENGAIPADFADEARQAWRNVAAILSKAGASISDIVSVRQYLTRPEDIKTYVDVRERDDQARARVHALGLQRAGMARDPRRNRGCRRRPVALRRSASAGAPLTATGMSRGPGTNDGELRDD